jgi:exopolyphosphatase / guanosine-5'-triphosphate,3'-diphosphate pyrophosphatase
LSDSISKQNEHRRLAAIDVGTNSIRLIVAELMQDGGYRIIDDEKERTRLGAGMDVSGKISDEALEVSAQAVARMHSIAKGYGVESVRAIATSAAREASNGQELVDLVREHAGLEMEIIKAEEEARLAHKSVRHAFDLTAQQAVTVDIGGGSTELVLSVNGVVEQLCLLRIGAVRLTEMTKQHEGNPDGQYDAMRDIVRDILKAKLGKSDFVPSVMYGCGGTFTNLATMAMHRTTPQAANDLLPFTVRGHDVQRDEVKHLLHWLRKLSPKLRASVPGLNPDRADIIVAGLVIIDEIMRRLKMNRLRVHDRGIRDGVLLTMIEELGLPDDGDGGGRIDRIGFAERFALQCRFEEPHCRHVAGMAMSIFDALAEHIGEDAVSWSVFHRELLYAAALLHDVGYLINYSKHHKHSYHLIAHSDMPGLTTREREIVANVARYHRRATPKSRHPNYMKLPEEDREIVRRLSGILRIADKLDRTHTQAVDRVELKIQKELGESRAVFCVVAEQEPVAEIWGAARHSVLFERVFDLECDFRWTQGIT